MEHPLSYFSQTVDHLQTIFSQFFVMILIHSITCNPTLLLVNLIKSLVELSQYQVVSTLSMPVSSPQLLLCLVTSISFQGTLQGLILQAPS